ncbi:MAG: hypothetical protein A3B96_04015 [Candidatus Spechtbacteria bacterium RIFCSPHIGHO2_02_FULL_43_15b]|uniref:DoxX family protein n=1 Tax=Candidatus Spechtbacteria bacterium RIFCSPHIGHO2_01_FULL_43_30 TaxID=1802158 RepID=A0A1G2H8A2_9BACT|nr:MAG: hypothetical protein A2827_01980 [Candidatus Spechtbacteria bacterium RIFCSPHIGHO2_01_FULL_43_30]OGZ60387.1 MAG: hypothetical protein A3B96_04015 [Candidatus Spechtbacteria bacterium RIFCSPHIGHO2_02_FULL_43_15b]
MGIFSSYKIIVKDPTISRKLFSEVGIWSIVWLIARVYLGWGWLSAGWEKISGKGANPWGPESVLAFWQRVVEVPEPPAHPEIVYGWYRGFIQLLMEVNAQTWFAPTVAWGEFLVGMLLILGAFVGIAATAGAFMNLNFMLSGVASVNPIMYSLAIILILSWKTAGWWGLDRWLLPKIGVPWSKVEVKDANTPNN